MMDDPEGGIDAPDQQPRKKQKTEVEFRNRMTLNRFAYEWKLTLLHAPDFTFAAFEDRFSPIKLKQIDKGMKYGKWQAVEVSFWTESDLLRALEMFNHKLLRSHYVTLKYPAEALSEMEATESGWKSLPYYLVDDILEQLSSCREGKLLKRVCRNWKEAVQKAERAYPLLVLSTNPVRASAYTVDNGPKTIGGDIKHIVSCHPNDYIDGFGMMFSRNTHLERLTLFGSDTLTSGSI